MTDILRIDHADMTPAPWLWQGRLPAGRLTLIDAMPGTGKTTIAATIAASVSAGMPWIDGQPGPEPGTVIWIGYEDDPGIVAGRILAAGGDPAKVVMISKGQAGKPISLPRDISELEELVAAVSPKLIVIDPLSGFLDIRGTDGSVRTKMMPVIEIARKNNVAVIGLRHPTKGAMSTSGPALYAGGGSVAIAAVARAAMMIARDPYGDLVIASSKSSIAEHPASIELVMNTALNGHPALRSPGVSPFKNADDLIAAVREGRAPIASAHSTALSHRRIAALRESIAQPAQAPTVESADGKDYGQEDIDRDVSMIAAALIRA